MADWHCLLPYRPKLHRGLVEVIDVFVPQNWRVLKRFEAHPGAITKLGVDAQTLWLVREVG